MPVLAGLALSPFGKALVHGLVYGGPVLAAVDVVTIYRSSLPKQFFVYKYSTQEC